MVAFDCPQCGKPLIVPNRNAGQTMTCPGCAAELCVPDAPPRRRPGRRRLVLAAVAVTALAVVFGFLWLRKDRPTVIRERFAARLAVLSPDWQEIEWIKLSPADGYYKVGVKYPGERSTYTFEVVGIDAADQVLVRINPREPGWLAYAMFGKDVRSDSFEYMGGDPAEKALLQSHAWDLCDALRHAVR